MSSSSHRWLAACLLALWLAPSAGILSVGLHVALDHHSHHGNEHTHGSPGLPSAVSENHHDDEALLDHQHSFDTSAPILRASAKPAFTPSIPFHDGSPAAERARLSLAAKRAAPTSLFTTNCSLLL